jgi:hypothetical protein
MSAAAAGQTVTHYARTAGVDRWQWGKGNVAESGSDAGSDYFMNRYSDAGAYLGTPFTISRATGLAAFATSLEVTGTLSATGTLGVGGAGNASYGVNVVNAALTGTSQYGVVANPTFSSAATGNATGFASNVATAVSAATHALVHGFRAFDATKGAGSTITALHGIYINDQTQGTSNFGLTSIVSSGTNKWNLFISGTAANHIQGDLLVGTTSAGLSGVTIYNAVTNSNVGRVDIAKSASGAATAMTFRYVATAVGSITYDDTSTGFNTSSDYRLKDNIQNAPDAAGLIDAIQVRQFNWKAGGSHQRYGFIAQELVTVAPEAVYTPTDPDEMMAVDYSKLVPMLVKELQSLRARVTQLESNP